MDASETGAWAYLLQDEHPISYFSKKFNSHQRADSTIEKEALVLPFRGPAGPCFYAPQPLSFYKADEKQQPTNNTLGPRVGVLQYPSEAHLRRGRYRRCAITLLSEC